MKRFIATLCVAVASAFAHPAHAVPIIVGTDFTAVPTNTTWTLDGINYHQNGDGGNGGYLSVCGTGMGSLANYGPTGTNHVYMVDGSNTSHEVAAYVSMSTPPWATDITTGDAPNIQCVRVQVGSLGGATYGTPLDIDVVVAGNHATYNKQTGSAPITYYGLLLAQNASHQRSGYVADYEALTFTPIDGRVIYVDCTNGNDSNLGLIASPMLTVQSSDAVHGAIPVNHAYPDESGIHPATQVVIRGGTCPVQGQWDGTATANTGRWAYLFRVTGTAPGSSAWQGPISITSYPGETAVYDGTSTTHAGGGFLGNDTTREGEQNPYDSVTGWAHNIEMSWLTIKGPQYGPRDGAPFNLGYGMDNSRFFANDAQWDDLQDDNGTNGGHCAALCGDGVHVRIALNYFHDVYNGANTGANQDQQHLVYLDSGCCEATFDATVAFNGLTNAAGGNSVNINASGCIGVPMSGDCTIGGGYIKNVFIYNNWMTGAHKSNVICNWCKTTYVFNNVMNAAGISSVNIANGSLLATNGFQAFHNDIVDWDQLNGARYAWWDQGGDGTGSWDARNNITVRRSTGLGSGAWLLTSYNTYLFTNDIWYDATGNLATTTIPDCGTPCSPDLGGSYANPKFNSISTLDLTLKSTSPAIGAATSLLGTVPRDFGFNFDSSTLTSPADIGAFQH